MTKTVKTRHQYDIVSSHTYKKFGDAITEMHNINKTIHAGINFTLCMLDNESGDMTLHTRIYQPCYGELRKYKKTHPKDCTQPNNTKPSDLHCPFPDGTPLAISVTFGARGTNFQTRILKEQNYIRYMFSNDSPWLKGFKHEKHIEWTLKDDNIIGFVLKTTEIDPTVFVNLLNNIKSYLQYEEEGLFDKLVSKGLSKRQAVLFISSISMKLSKMYRVVRQHQQQGYYTPHHIDIERFIKRNPHDLSGGTFQDRVDYNRTDLQNIFSFQKSYPSKQLDNGFSLTKIIENSKAVKFESTDQLEDSLITEFKKGVKTLLMKQKEMLVDNSGN